jgi:DNA-binding GntR family transcriptional regulator
MPLVPISDARLLKDRAYAALSEAIIRLELEPGEALTERVLSERLGVSKSPIRDALIQLESEGLVRSTPFKGFIVAPLTEDGVRDTMQFKEILAVYAVRSFAESAPPPQLAALEQAHRHQRELLDTDHVAGAWEEQGRFIQILLEALGNPLVNSANRVIQAHILRLRNLASTIPGRIEKTYSEHEVILEAVRARDAQRAQDLMRAHFRSILDNLLAADELRALVETPPAEKRRASVAPIARKGNSTFTEKENP